MIRTRDVVVFFCALLFVCVGIALTLVFDVRSHVRDFAFVPYFEVSTTSEFTAQAPNTSPDRISLIEHLRTALGNMEREVEPEPSVESSPSVSSDDAEDSFQMLSGVLSCGTDDTQSTTRAWPLSLVSITTEGVSRVVVVSSDASELPAVSSTTASSTPPKTAALSKPLISFPQSPVVNTTPSCVPGGVIGVTLNGSLMHNTDASFYKGYGAEYLIGYARDGFPIYGYYEGAVDQCGGYVHANGYRYTISPDRAYVVGCFKGIPSPFTI